MRRKRKRIIYCADFETTPLAQYKIEGKTRVYLWEIKKLDNTYKKVGLTIKDFFDEISTFEDDCEIYFHNLSFDGEFILHYLVSMGYQFTDNRDNVGERQFFNITDNFTHHFLIFVVLDNKKQITFKCSYRLFPLSIKKMGKLVNLEKLNETHNYEELKLFNSIEEVSEEELSYLENDVEIMRRFLIYMEDLGLNGLTMASVSYNQWKRTEFFFSKTLPIIDDDIAVEIINFSYRGGITYVNPVYQGKTLEDVISFDVNSLYPSVMLDGKMPYGKPIVYDSLDSAYKNPSYDLRIVSFVVHSAKIRNGYIPFIPTNNSFLFKGSYDYPKTLNNKILCLWEEEYKLFTQYYDCDIEVAHVLAFTSKYGIFEKYLEPLKKAKENEKDPVARAITKLKMNSLYGKFGQSPNRISKQVENIDEDGILRYKSAETEGLHFYKPIASRIASLARCKLISAIESEPSRFVYCDTDSIYLKGSTFPDIPIHSSILGYWKFEGHYSKALFQKAKGYIKTFSSTSYNDKNKWNIQESSVAGLPKELQALITYDNFKDGMTFIGSKKIMKRVNGGVIIANTNFTLKLKKDVVDISY